MRQLTNFPSFEQLPVEIQRAIWQAAIPPLQPTVYPAIAKVQPKQKNEDGTLNIDNDVWRTHLDNAVKGGRTSNQYIATLSSLLFCCRLASQVALAAYKQNQPKGSLLVRGLRHRIDGSCDLLMFCQGWQETCLNLAWRLVDNAPRRSLYNFSVLWPGPQTKEFWTWNGLRHILNLWIDLKTFYVVVDPKHLEPKPWLPEMDRKWVQPHLAPEGQLFSTFIGHYRQSYEQQTPNVFYDGDREYFEVSTEVVAEAGALEDVAEFLWDARDVVDSFYDVYRILPVRCLILTWRQI